MARKTTTKTASKRKTAKRGAKTSAGRGRTTKARSAAGKPASRSKSAKSAAKRKTGRAKAAKTTKAAKTAKAAKTRSAAKARSAAKTRPSSKNGQAMQSASELAVGSPAPDFRLTRDGGATVMLGDFTGRKLVIYFYPRANTPGCTREAIDFSRLSNEFARAGTDVIGVSADSIKAQESFRDGHNLTTPLLSDTTRAMLKDYRAWGTKSNYGKTYEGIIRSTILIDRQGRIAQVWRDVRVDGHADAVLQVARAL